MGTEAGVHRMTLVHAMRWAGYMLWRFRLDTGEHVVSVTQPRPSS